jgi:uncharacterized protein YggE
MFIPSALFLGACAPAIVPVSGPAREQVATITVVGQGEASARPDIARTNLGVEATAATVPEAMRLANERMNAVITALKGLGIAERDIRTSNFSIYFERAPQPAAGSVARPATQPQGVYRVSNLVEVTIRDLNQASAVLQAAVDAGANTAWNISFELDNSKPVETQALERAVDDGRANAEALARRTGVALGQIISISEVIGSAPTPIFAEAASFKAADAGPPIERGELTFSTRVQIVYAIPMAAK